MKRAAEEKTLNDLKAKYQQEHDKDGYEMSADSLPKDYLDQYENPDIFNQEYQKYLTHLNADVDEEGNSGDPDFASAERMDFYE